MGGPRLGKHQHILKVKLHALCMRGSQPLPQSLPVRDSEVRTLHISHTSGAQQALPA